MKKTTFFIAFTLFLFLATACGGRQSQQTADDGYTMTLEPMANAVGETMLMITLTTADGTPIDDADLTVRGDMTHAGMTPVTREVSGGTDGIFTVPFEWTMAGDWFVTVDAALPDGETISRRFEDISIDGEGGMDMDMGEDG